MATLPVSKCTDKQVEEVPEELVEKSTTSTVIKLCHTYNHL